MRDKTPLKKGQISTAGLLAEYRQNTAMAILASLDVLKKGIRDGVEQGQFVYRRGELIFAQGTPWAEIHLDENSLLYTADYAREYHIWPKPPVAVQPATDSGGKTETTHPGGDVKNTPPPPDKSLIADGVLREALKNLWEQARQRKLATIRELRIRLSHIDDASRLAADLQRLPDSAGTIQFDGGYDAHDGSSLTLEFRGSLKEAGFVLDFLKTQGRAAKATDLSANFTITFTNGLPLADSSAEQLTERLARFVSGGAVVSAAEE
jgi:hypothetical protein